MPKRKREFRIDQLPCITPEGHRVFVAAALDPDGGPYVRIDQPSGEPAMEVLADASVNIVDGIADQLARGGFACGHKSCIMKIILLNIARVTLDAAKEEDEQGDHESEAAEEMFEALLARAKKNGPHTH